jgi:hypothetical protein
MTKRIYGKELDKDLQQFIAEASELGYEEVSYAILDALLPIVLFHVYFGSLMNGKNLLQLTEDEKNISGFLMEKYHDGLFKKGQFKTKKLSLFGQSCSPSFETDQLVEFKFIVDKMCVQVGDELVKKGYDCYFIEDQNYDRKNSIIKNLANCV